ncbi:unnamed protein product [Protopolystoma xenopodis]|uniref:Uncharacterized protein n=1 Tax=Protopolystoma xenopodis TaxID=117903 RepID=A0A448X4R7_9PLAT|nr:unnamed protein product [Protopolystoma xenopodis]
MFGEEISEELREEVDILPETDLMNQRCIPATFNLLHFIAWRPDPSQLKPLPPGSAKFSLKDISRFSEIEKEYEKHHK